MSEPGAVLQLAGVSKRFVGVQALDDVDFELASGEVHALVGENGAGKSTLIKLMTGAHAFDAGRMRLDGRPVQPKSPAAALELGISSVYQEVNLLPNLSVARNLFLGREPRRFAGIDRKTMQASADRLLRRFGLDIDVRQSLGSFSIAVRQLVAIARAIDRSARVLVLDEPTASLDAEEAGLLFRIVAGLKSDGLGIVFVTHFLDQVYAVSDRITVLRNGRRVGTFDAAALPRAELISLMLGKELQSVERERSPGERAGSGAPVIEASGLAADNGLHDLSFTVTSGEALGLAGLLGSGRTELCELLYGLAAVTGGRLAILGREGRFESPARALGGGVALCPEDRKTAGILGPLSVRQNIAIGLQARRGWWRRIPVAEQERLADRAIAELGIVCADADVAVETLSGGNQQKVILARWLGIEPRILILDEPTRGIDIGAHAEIIRLIRRLRDGGLTVIIASSETDELAAFSDRVLVLREGTAVAGLAGDAVNEPAIVAAIVQAG